ncbi:hypothetical protein Q0812_08745 [Brevundimonas sp. 2R-24]|uniref:Uncharacterized protein n=1 Tax=Peiella sedimenti TaxID=3061083 RepID=A0ABT8SLS6_9CAUL|nr:hypothetical protein [Caulobacteraceae bacterium XZ-24]
MKIAVNGVADLPPIRGAQLSLGQNLAQALQDDDRRRLAASTNRHLRWVNKLDDVGGFGVMANHICFLSGQWLTTLQVMHRPVRVGRRVTWAR